MSHLRINDGTERKVLCIANDPTNLDPFPGFEDCYILVPGKEYTLVDTEVHSWHTLVTIAEHPDIQFNSVLFEELGDEEYDIERPYLHPCPLCGDKNILAWGENKYMAECGCMNCHITTYADGEKDYEELRTEAISSWNNMCYRFEKGKSK